MQRFKDLMVWQRSQALAVRVYGLTAPLPRDERLGITSQIRRAIVSVPANIAEGSKRESNADFGRFLNIAEGSLAESESLLLLASGLGYLTHDSLELCAAEMAQIGKMLHSLRMKVVASRRQPRQSFDNK